MALEIDDLVQVSDDEHYGRGLLKDVFGDQVLVAMKGQDDQRITVHRNNIKKIQPSPTVN